MEAPEHPKFDPNWSREQARAAGTDGPLSPFEQWQAWLLIEAFKSSYEEGDASALLRVLRLCAIHRLPMPEWAANAYVGAFRSWENHTVGTLGEAFDVTLPKGRHLNALRKARKLNFAVPALVIRLKKQGRPIDEGMFAEIGAALNVSASAARQAYYASSYFKRFQKRS